VACASGQTDGSSFGSVRERLAAEPTRLSIDTAVDVGTLEARRWSAADDAWISGTATVVSSGGGLVVQLDRSGKLVAQQFDLAVDAIELPTTLVGKELALRDVHVALAKAPPVDITWTTDDEGAARLPITLTLSWSVAIDSQLVPLSDQKLEAITMDVSLIGSGDHVDATVGLQAQGTLWSWAELLELTKIDLTMAAATIE